MYTSVVLVALSGSVVASYAAHDLAWQTDYAQAREMGEAPQAGGNTGRTTSPYDEPSPWDRDQRGGRPLGHGPWG